jgi:hypothetical protein
MPEPADELSGQMLSLRRAAAVSAGKQPTAEREVFCNVAAPLIDEMAGAVHVVQRAPQRYEVLIHHHVPFASSGRATPEAPGASSSTRRSATAR